MDTTAESGELTLTLNDRRGQGSVTVGVDDPWAGPWRQAMVVGRPTAPWRGIAIRYQGVPYSLGFVSLSEGQRLLWFPGASLSASEYIEDTTGQLTRFVGRPVDHLTLDPDFAHGRQRSHLTYVDGLHGPKITHRHRAGDLTLWFSLLLPDTSSLRVVPESLSINFTPSRHDPDYPQQLAGQGCWEFLEAADDPIPPTFIQFDVWAGMWSGWEQDRFAFLPLAGQLGIADPERDKVYPRMARLQFTPECGLGLVVAWVPGRLKKPTMIRHSSVKGSLPPLPSPGAGST